MSEMIDRSLIRRDGGTQPRAGLDEATVSAYAEAMEAGAEFPACGVVYDGTDYWLWDGFHRDAARGRLGLSLLSCSVTAGTRRDAVLLAAGANATHGLPRTPADKRRAVLILLDDPDWAQWSDREIARRAQVSHPFVAGVRAVTGNVSTERAYVTRHGTVSTMAVGKAVADPDTPAKPEPDELYTRLIVRRDAARLAAKAQRAAAVVVAPVESASACAPLVSLSLRERKVLTVLADGYDPVEWRGYPFKTIAARCDVEPWLVRRVVRALARKGLAQFERGLWSEDGVPAGSGYRCTAEGFERLRQVYDPPDTDGASTVEVRP